RGGPRCLGRRRARRTPRRGPAHDRRFPPHHGLAARMGRHRVRDRGGDACAAVGPAAMTGPRTPAGDGSPPSEVVYRPPLQALDRHPADGSWSARQVVHHLADSEMTSAIRLRRLLFEDDPVISGYDEAGYAEAFHYADRPIAPALTALRAARATTLQILATL